MDNLLKRKLLSLQGAALITYNLSVFLEQESNAYSNIEAAETIIRNYVLSLCANLYLVCDKIL